MANLPDMSTKEAASYLKKGERTLEGWRKQGFGPAYTRVGGTVRYSRDSLDAFLAARTVRPHRPAVRGAATILGAAA